MKSFLFLVSGILFIQLPTQAQTIYGTFPLLAGKTISLEGFKGFGKSLIASSTADKDGKFVLRYSASDRGMGCLSAPDNKPLVLVLGAEDIVVKGESFMEPEKANYDKSRDNQLFARYASEHPRREQALSAWVFLEKIYNRDSLFSVNKVPVLAIQKEESRIKNEDNTFLSAIDPKLYVSWYLPTRKLVSSVSAVAQFRTNEIPEVLAAFRKMDYTDMRMYRSGLLRETIEGHFWLIENSGRPLDSVYLEMQISIDAMIKNLATDSPKLNEITDFLFDLLEKHSLFKASEYLALKVLNESGCSIDANLSRQLETYRAMKKGNIAPDVNLSGMVKAPGYPAGNVPSKVSDIKTPYTVVAFGASWCPKCREEFPEIAKQYNKWKSQGVEVLFFSLDEDSAAYKDFVKEFPFISVCDFKKWSGSAVNAYYVFGTPTMFLVEKNRKILLRPNSVNQMDAWVDWYLVQGNKQ